MRRRTSWIPLAALLAIAGCHSPHIASEHQPDAYDIAPWADVLAACVRDGLVDYQRLRANHELNLDRYLDMVARHGPRAAPDTFPTEHDQLAFFLNAYNAIMLRRWLDAGAGNDDSPPDRSVNLLWFYVDHWRIDGRWASLNTIENHWIRPRFDEPRIHFALVCGAISCPPLLDEPYSGPRLDEQLEAQGRRWFNDEPDALAVDDEGTRLSLIFMWYFDDFRDSGMMPGLIERYVNAEDPRRAEALRALETGDARWLPYFWTINDASADLPAVARRPPPPVEP